MNLAISMPLPSVANLREHWRTVARRKKAQRLHVALSMRTHVDLLNLRRSIAAGLKLTVTLIRVAKRPLDDDNLASAFKAVRDQVAKELGTTDAPSGPITWVYRQKASTGVPGIMIVVGRVLADLEAAP